jgi:hypothetical protein
MARASRRAHWRDARFDNVHLELRTVLAHCQTRHVPPLRLFSGTPGHENHVLCWAREFAHRRACRTRHCAASVRVSMGTMPCGAPPGFRDGEARHSHQAGRRDVRRWPKPIEDENRLTPPLGGEPERRRDKRRTRRKAGGAEKRAQGRCCRARFSETRVAEPVVAEEEATCRRPKRNRRNDWHRVPWAPNATRHRCATSRAPQGTRLSGPVNRKGRGAEAVAATGSETRCSQNARLHPCHLDRSGEIPCSGRGTSVTP